MVSKRILLADDELGLVTSLASFLMVRPYDVVTVGDGQQALDCLKTDTFDLAVLDMRMPKLDGLAVLKHLHGQVRKTRIAILTGYATFEQAVGAMKLGAIDYLQKPITKQDFLAFVDGVLHLDNPQTLTREIVDYIQLNITRPDFSMQDVLSKFQMSRTRLFEALREHTGFSFQRYVRMCRIDKAKALLVGSSLLIKEIAVECGFVSSQWFARAFKAETATTPREYRKRMQKR